MTQNTIANIAGPITPIMMAVKRPGIPVITRSLNVTVLAPKRLVIPAIKATGNQMHAQPTAIGLKSGRTLRRLTFRVWCMEGGSVKVSGLTGRA